MAILGPGGVGGVLAVRLGLEGRRVICVASERTAAAIADGGLTLDAPDGHFATRPEVCVALNKPVDVLVVASKATTLQASLERIDPASVTGGVVVPLLNGLDHVPVVRSRFPGRVAVGSIGKIASWVDRPGRIVQHSQGAQIVLASNELAADEVVRAADALRADRVCVSIGASEAGVLWEKAARLAVFAAATSASGLVFGELRTSEWRERMVEAMREASAVAAAYGVDAPAEAQIAFLDALPAEATASTARDVEAGVASELDAITGSVVRAATRAGVPCPTLETLFAEALERAARCLVR